MLMKSKVAGNVWFSGFGSGQMTSMRSPEVTTEVAPQARDGRRPEGPLSIGASEASTLRRDQERAKRARPAAGAR